MASIERRGKHQFRARVRRDGHPVRYATFPTRAAAEAWAREIEIQLDRGLPVRSSEAERTTLAEALTRYRREITPTKKGAKQEAQRIERWLTDPLANRYLVSIRGADMAEYRDRRAQKVSSNTIRLELAIISNLYTVAATEWRLEGLTNPVQLIRKPKPSKARDRRLEPGEEALLLDAAPPILREAIIIAIETAMRRGELAGLKSADIDRRRRVAILHDTKNGDRREVPLTARAMGAIEALPARTDRTLFGPRTAAEWAITCGFRRLCKAVGVVGLTFHTLRHEATSRLFEKGLNIAEVGAITGHKSLQMLRRYTHLRAEDLLRKLEG